MAERRSLPREHGTPRGYNQHRRRGEPECPECHEAWNADRRARTASIKAEQAARRARWRAQDDLKAAAHG